MLIHSIHSRADHYIENLPGYEAEGSLHLTNDSDTVAFRLNGPNKQSYILAAINIVQFLKGNDFPSDLSEIFENLEQNAANVIPELFSQLFTLYTLSPLTEKQLVSMKDVLSASVISELSLEYSFVRWDDSGSYGLDLFLMYPDIEKTFPDIDSCLPRLRIYTNSYPAMDNTGNDLTSSDEVIAETSEPLSESTVSASEPAEEEYSGLVSEFLEVSNSASDTITGSAAAPVSEFIGAQKQAKITHLLQSYQSKLNSSGHFYIGSEIPSKKLRNAISAYGTSDIGQVYGLLDMSTFGSAKTGLIFADSGFCCKNSNTLIQIPYDQITDLSVNRFQSAESTDLIISTINNQYAVSMKHLNKLVLSDILQSIKDILHSK